MKKPRRRAAGQGLYLQHASKRATERASELDHAAQRPLMRRKASASHGEGLRYAGLSPRREKYALGQGQSRARLAPPRYVRARLVQRWLVALGRRFVTPAVKGASEGRVFAIDWLRLGVRIKRETSVLTNAENAIAAARKNADVTVARHHGREPDSFRLVDETGTIVGVFRIRERRH